MINFFQEAMCPTHRFPFEYQFIKQTEEKL